MRMRELLGWKVPEAVVGLWEQGEGERLLPLQELAVKRHGLFGGRNLLVQAPTSSGKTFIGEMAAIQSALRRKKVVYLAPLKALAEEKYLDFRAKYAGYGLKVIISTRDHREYDEALEEGRFSVAVVVYEKLSQLLVRRPERLADIDLVIADELELLSDPERGAMVELLLARIIQGGCRLIGLSAVIGDTERLARWMDAELVQYQQRPVELRYGVLHEGTFRYRTYNDLGQGEEALVDAESESPWEILTQNLCRFVRNGESCLVFVKAKHESRRGAALLAGRVDLPEATRAMEKLRGLEPTRSRDALLHTMAHGVAFHNADLSPVERRIVEEAFREGEVMALVSTGTLAVGLNLPARNVFISPEKWRYDERLDIPWKTPVLHHEYENMGGRAGRYGAGHAFGRSILIAASPFDFEALWRRYVEGEREGIAPRLARAPLDAHILRIVASRHCRTVAELTRFLESTLSGQWVWLEEYTRDEVVCRVRSAVHRCVELGLMQEDQRGALAATPLGMAVSGKGIGLETARLLGEWLAAMAHRDWHPLELLLAAALTPDGRLLQVMLTSREYEQGGYLSRLKRAAQDIDDTPDTPLNRLRRSQAAPFFDEVRAIKGALFLQAWLEEMPMQDIEEEYSTMAGQVLAAAEQIGWLVDATAAVAGAMGVGEGCIARLEELSRRLHLGVESDLLDIAQLELDGVSRSALIALRGGGLHEAATLALSPVAVLEQWMPRKSAMELVQWAERQSGTHAGADASTPVAAPQTPRPAQKALLVIDETRPGEVLLDGEPVPLQEKQYQLLRVLARQPGECVPYEEVYDALWGDAVVEQGQMYSQKRNLVKRLAAARPDCATLIATRAKHGFVLQLAPGQVLIKQRRAGVAA